MSTRIGIANDERISSSRFGGVEKYNREKPNNDKLE